MTTTRREPSEGVSAPCNAYGPCDCFPSRIEDSPLIQYFILLTSQAVLFTWLYNNTRGSVLLAILFHTSFNVVGAFFFQMYMGTEYYQLLWWIYAATVSLAATVVVLIAGADRLSRRFQAVITT